MNQSLLTVHQLSSFLHVHPKTLYRWTNERKLPFVKINGLIRFNRKEIEEWQNSNKKNIPIFPPDLPRFDFPLAAYDRMLLKGESVLSNKNSRRWNYGFGAVYTRKTKQGKNRFYIDYRDCEGKRNQMLVKAATTREQAFHVLKKTVFDVYARENEIQLQKEKIKFCEFADMYLESYAKTNKKSWKSDYYYLKGIKSYFAESFLHEITSLEVENYKRDRLIEAENERTVNRCLAILSKMFKLAVEWRYLRKEQLPVFRLFPEKDNIKERILTEDEEFRLLNECADHIRSIVSVALLTGMRQGEILNLRWKQIDFNRRTICVEKTKNGKIRFIPISTPLFEQLQQLRTKSNNEYVFVNPDTGKPYVWLKTGYKAACRRAKISDLRFHDLRHTFASRLVERGADIITVKELLGHSSVKMTERYTHSSSKQKRQAVELLGEKSQILPDLLHICDRKKEKTSKEVSSQ